MSNSDDKGFSRRETFVLGTAAAGAVIATRAVAAQAGGDNPAEPAAKPYRIVDAQRGVQVSTAGEDASGSQRERADADHSTRRPDRRRPELVEG